jgi:transcription elongation GreA/GreB family factor
MGKRFGRSQKRELRAIVEELGDLAKAQERRALAAEAEVMRYARRVGELERKLRDAIFVDVATERYLADITVRVGRSHGLIG